MRDFLTIETLLDLCVYRDVETANARVKQYGLSAAIDLDGDIVIYNVDEFKTVAIIDGKTGRVIYCAYDLDTRVDTINRVGALLTTAQEGSETESYASLESVAETPCFRSGEGPIKYKSEFRDIFPKRDQAWGNLGATPADKRLEANYRARLRPGTQLSTLLHLYKNGFPQAKAADTDKIWSVKIDDAGRVTGVEESHKTVDSASDERAVNNRMRHTYRVLNDDEKAAMENIKDLGLELIEAVEALGKSREYALAITKVEEAVMWAVRGLTT